MPRKLPTSVNKRILRETFGGALLAGTCLLLAASAAQANPVDCDNGGDLPQAVFDLSPGTVFVEFTGTCNLSRPLFIGRDDVIVDGGGTGVIKGPISIVGDRVQLLNMTVRGSGAGAGIVIDHGSVSVLNVTVENFNNGANVINSAAALFFNSTIKNNANNGIFASASAVTVSNSTLEDNGNAGISTRGAHVEISGSTIENNARFGLIATENSNVRVTNGKIEIDVAAAPGGDAAIGVFRQSHVHLRGAPRIENTNAAGIAINLGQQSWLRQGNGLAKIEAGDEVLRVGTQSGADLRAFNTEGTINARDQSFVTLRNGTANGDIRLRRDSDVLFLDTDGPVSVEGNLICDDDDSKATLAAGTTVSGSNDCTGFTKTP